MSSLNLRKRILYQLLFCHLFYEVMAPRPAILEHSDSVETTRPRYWNRIRYADKDATPVGEGSVLLRFDGTFHLAIRLALNHGLALIVDLLAPGQADLYLCDSLFVKVQLQRD